MSGREHSIREGKDSATSSPSRNLITIASSAGGLDPLREVLAGLPADLSAAIVILQHLGVRSRLPAILQSDIRMRIKFAENDEPLRSGIAYVCPPHVHVVIRPTRTVALSNTPAVRFARSSADWLLESAAASYRKCAVAVILSGGMSDGARGVIWMRKAGAHTIAQAPSTCGASSMPLAAIRTGCVDEVLRPDQIASALQVAVRRHNSTVRFRAWEEPFGSPN